MRILIVEDEARIAKRIERMLRTIFGDSIIAIQTADDLEKGQKIIASGNIDLLFLDLNLNGEDGFEILKSMVAESFHTIIISAYKDKAIEAFEYGVLDFVPKPFDLERLSKACSRIKEKKEAGTVTKFLSIKKRGKRLLIPVEEIKYIKGAGIYTELYLKNGGKEVHNKSLESLQLILPDTFERIHKSFLVSMRGAKEIRVEPGSKYSLILQTEESLPIGRTRYKELQEKWFS